MAGLMDGIASSVHSLFEYRESGRKARKYPDHEREACPGGFRRGHEDGRDKNSRQGRIDPVHGSGNDSEPGLQRESGLVVMWYVAYLSFLQNQLNTFPLPISPLSSGMVNRMKSISLSGLSRLDASHFLFL